MAMHPAYFETHFLVNEPIVDWPAEFAIITACATTGQHWSAENVAAAHRRLSERLEQTGVWHQPVTGYSPATGHAELGWAAALELGAACQVGKEFLQDAIFYIQDDRLLVVSCSLPEHVEPVGGFRERVEIRGLPRKQNVSK